MTRTSELVAIGARDLMPPEGRVTLELRSATTGRLRKRVQVENALMDWYKAAVLRNGGRGTFDVQTFQTNLWGTGANPLAYSQSVGTVVPTEQGLAGMVLPGRWPSFYGVTRTATNWLWATAANVAPDATKLHIPTVGGPEVTAGGLLNFVWSADGIQNKRGAVNLALTARTWARNRMVVDFSTSEGNGTYRSIGIGTLIGQRIAPGGLRPFPASVRSFQTLTNNTETSIVGQLAGWTSLVQVAAGRNSDAWAVDTGFQLSRFNLLSGPVGAVAFTVTAGNVPGSGGPNGPVVEQTASDFWVARNQTLYRCVTPVSNVAMTVTNTYALGATLGAEAILDITFDGTNLYLLTLTRVYVVNPATGASTSNWAHGLTGGTLGYQSIVYDSAEQLLWINFVDRTTGGVTQWGASASGSNISVTPDSLTCYGFTTAGVLTKWSMGRHTGMGGGTQQPGRQLGLIRSDGQFFMRIGSDSSAVQKADVYGPSMATHALLGADVVKTSDDVMRITYDFDFS